jgi:hypothetical protein
VRQPPPRVRLTRPGSCVMCGARCRYGQKFDGGAREVPWCLPHWAEVTQRPLLALTPVQAA